MVECLALWLAAVTKEAAGAKGTGEQSSASALVDMFPYLIVPENGRGRFCPSAADALAHQYIAR